MNHGHGADPLEMKPSSEFKAAVTGLLAGDFSRLAPLFARAADGSPGPIVRWHEAGLFQLEPDALKEAFTCACFNGYVEVAEYLLAHGVDPSGGAGTGLNAFHWAANRGQLATVRLLIRHRAPLEVRNSYGGTVLGCAVWSAVHEPKPDHHRIVAELLAAGAQVREADHPSGDQHLDALLRGALDRTGDSACAQRPGAFISPAGA